MRNLNCNSVQNVKNVVEEKISSLSIFTCQVFDCEEDSFVPSFTFTDVSDNEIDFMSKYFLNQITVRYRMNQIPKVACY